MRGKYVQFAAGILVGAVMFGGGTAVAAGLTANPSSQTFYVNGQCIALTAYSIGGSNFVKLRDIGRAVDFGVEYIGSTNSVYIDPDAPYVEEMKKGGQNTNQEIRSEIIRLVNQIRAENGAPELAVSQALMDAAQERAETMYTYHRTKEDCEAVSRHGYPYGFGANITTFTGISTSDAARKAVENWTKSPGHFQTMIDPDGTAVGVGFAEDAYKTVCYLFIGNPKSVNPYA